MSEKIPTHEIGRLLTYKNTLLQIQKRDGKRTCTHCYFKTGIHICSKPFAKSSYYGYCWSKYRKDKKDVIYKRIE